MIAGLITLATSVGLSVWLLRSDWAEPVSAESAITEER